MSAYEVGDRVRVAHEGVVTGEDVEAQRVYLDGGNPVGGVTLPLRTADVTVLERRKPKVGDALDDRGVTYLPNGTVIKHRRYGGHFVASNGQWFSASLGRVVVAPKSPVDEYTIAYLPG